MLWKVRVEVVLAVVGRALGCCFWILAGSEFPSVCWLERFQKGQSSRQGRRLGLFVAGLGRSCPEEEIVPCLSRLGIFMQVMRCVTLTNAEILGNSAIPREMISFLEGANTSLFTRVLPRMASCRMGTQKAA